MSRPPTLQEELRQLRAEVRWIRRKLFLLAVWMTAASFTGLATAIAFGRLVSKAVD